MGPFFASLISEHREIKVLLDRLHDHARSIDLNTVVDVAEIHSLVVALNKIIDVHHEIEEGILFPAIQRLRILDNGGPRCTEFLQIKIEWNPVGAIFSRSPDFACELPIPRHDMLSIPLEEHVAGHLSRQLIAQALQNPLRADSSRRALGTLIQDFVFLMNQHIHKEDECLFILADQHLTTELQKEMMKHAQEKMP